ncbi:hypothetical protein SCP_0806150 [Sparassis crispa]|uniref:DNA polymerase epsilon subunit D n=1 Tax=Sparassis crispa TaxID=139825 RepID=A0A401GV31_9APHY|nr:hypothetical protein SCP_0806150 [Sparassis crispa]GBE86091.1 hypothetical protein SCP_0806150 [Sparassis crispa]
MPRSKEANTGSVSALIAQETVPEGIDSFELPRSLVTRIARSALPDHVKIQKEVILSIVKSATVFINYLAATAHDVASSKQHKSISASDVLKGLELIEIGDMVELLQQELLVYREIQKADKNKRGGGSVASVKGKARESEQTSISAASAKSKGRGKEREKGPTITISRPQARASAPGPATEFEQGEETDGDLRPEHDTELDQVGDPDDEEMLDYSEVQEDAYEEGREDAGEIEDVMVVEEEEQTRDARGLEEADYD